MSPQEAKMLEDVRGIRCLIFPNRTVAKPDPHVRPSFGNFIAFGDWVISYDPLHYRVVYVPDKDNVSTLRAYISHCSNDILQKIFQTGIIDLTEGFVKAGIVSPIPPEEGRWSA